VTVQNDKGGTFLGFSEDVQSVLDALDVVGIADAQDVPSIRQEPGRDVLRESYTRVPLDGDVIVVVDPAKVIEPKMARQGRCFRSDALHHASISANGINIVIENLKTGPVVVVGEPFFRDAHPDARGHSLAKWAGRGFNA
jgi:hypothetical protein